MKRVFAALLTLVLTLFAVAAQATPHVKWSAKVEPTDARAGESAQIILTASIEPTWHIYALKQQGGPTPTSFELPTNSILSSMGEPMQPEPKSLFDKNFNATVGEFEGAATFAIPVKLKEGISGAQKITVKATSQTCNDRLCARPDTASVDVRFTVAAGTARSGRTAAITGIPPQPAVENPAASGGPQPKQAPTDSFSLNVKKAQQNGILAYIWLSFIAGLLALLTPCVFPMIPITVSYFAKTGGNENKVNYQGAIAYCLGIIGTFTALGILVTAIFGATGVQRLATNPVLNLVLALLFITLAFSLFGVFELRLPSGLINRSNQASRDKGILGPVLMGLTFTLTSFTCTVPFVGTSLGAAASGSYLYPIVGMLAFSTAFALPFFLLAMFPQYLAKLPKSGSWLNTVKGFMAFLELAAALKFLSNADLVWQTALLTRPVFLAVWAIIGVVAALYLFGLFVVGHTFQGQKIGWLRAAFGVATLGASIWFLAALKGTSLGDLNAFVPPDPYPGHKAAFVAGDIHWIEKYSDALAQARAQKKPMFVDFTGVTCTNCRWMEQNMFTRPEVKNLIVSYIPVELYTDRQTEEDRNNAKLQRELTNSDALPTYALVSPDGKALKVFEGSTRDAQEFVAFLQTTASTRVAAK